MLVWHIGESASTDRAEYFGSIIDTIGGANGIISIIRPMFCFRIWSMIRLNSGIGSSSSLYLNDRLSICERRGQGWNFRRRCTVNCRGLFLNELLMSLNRDRGLFSLLMDFNLRSGRVDHDIILSIVVFQLRILVDELELCCLAGTVNIKYDRPAHLQEMMDARQEHNRR